MKQSLPHTTEIKGVTVERGTVEANELIEQLESLRICFPNGFAYRLLSCGVIEHEGTGQYQLKVFVNSGVLRAAGLWSDAEAAQ